MTASVLWSTGAGYSVSAASPGPIPTIITVPPTAPLVGTSASLFALVTSASPGSGGSVATGHALYTGSFIATGTLAPINLIPTIGQDYPNFGDPAGYGAYALFLTDPSIALGGELTISVNLGADNLGLSDTGSIGICVVDPQLPSGYEPWWIALVGGASGLPSATSSTFQMPSQLGPYLCLMTLSMVGASSAPVASTDDITLTPNTFLVSSANGTTSAFASYVSPYNDLTPLTYPAFPNLEPHMLGSWSWTTATNLYSPMMFWLGPKPATTLANQLWVWGQYGLNAPIEITIVDRPDEHFLKVVSGGASNPNDPIGTGVRYTALSNAGNVYSRGWNDGKGEGSFHYSFRFDPFTDGFGQVFASSAVAGLPQGTLVDISNSHNASFALDRLGQLWAWSSANDTTGDTGAGLFDQFGTPLPQPTPFVTLTNVAYFAAGEQYCIAQKTNGSWWAVGNSADADGLSMWNLDGTIYKDDSNLFAVEVAPFWNPVPALDTLDTVKVVNGDYGDGPLSLFIQRDGTVWAGGGQSYLFSGPAQNITGINYNQFLSLDSSGLIIQDPQVHHLNQIPWATNIVDAAIVDGLFALYLTADGTVYVVSNNVNVYGGPLDNPILITPAFPAITIALPPGVIAVALYPGGGAIIGSDNLLYTLGVPIVAPPTYTAPLAWTPSGELTEPGTLGEAPDVLAAELAFINSLPDDQRLGWYTAGGSPDFPFLSLQPVSLNRLKQPIVGGFADYGFRVYALTSGSATGGGAGGGGGFVIPPLIIPGRSYGAVIG